MIFCCTTSYLKVCFYYLSSKYIVRAMPIYLCVGLSYFANHTAFSIYVELLDKILYTSVMQIIIYKKKK